MYNRFSGSLNERASEPWTDTRVSPPRTAADGRGHGCFASDCTLAALDPTPYNKVYKVVQRRTAWDSVGRTASCCVGFGSSGSNLIPKG